VLAIVRPNLDGVLAVRREQLTPKSPEQLETTAALVVDDGLSELAEAGVGHRWYFNLDD
jgi:hypothetical protein